MNDTPASMASAQAQYEALRERWNQAKANGSVEAFARELFEQSEMIPVPAGRVYESESERATYQWAGENVPVTPNDVLTLLPLYFGDEKGTPMEQVLAELEAEATDGGPAGK